MAGGRPIRPSLWCRRDESYIFSDFLRRNAGTNSTAGTSFDFLAGFTAFIRKEKEKGEKREKKRIRLALLKVILLTSSL